MLKINPINNVYNTLNQISFKSGVQTNYGLSVPSPNSNMVEGGILPGFVGTVIPMFNKIQSRAESIQKGLEQTSLDYIA